MFPKLCLLLLSIGKFWILCVTTESSNLSLNNTDYELATEKPVNGTVPANGIGFIVEGIEISDFGLSRKFSDYQRSRDALGFQGCYEDGDVEERPSEKQPEGEEDKLSLLKVYYESQIGPSNYEPEANMAIRILCWHSGMENFCACDESGECFVPLKVPTYVEVQPFCDPEESCHAYLELYLGSLRSETNSTRFYGHLFDAGPFGHRSVYMKAAAVGCNGCGRLRGAMAGGDGEGGGKCRGQFVPSKLRAQQLKKTQIGVEKVEEEAKKDENKGHGGSTPDEGDEGEEKPKPEEDDVLREEKSGADEDGQEKPDEGKEKSKPEEDEGQQEGSKPDENDALSEEKPGAANDDTPMEEISKTDEDEVPREAKTDENDTLREEKSKSADEDDHKNEKKPETEVEQNGEEKLNVELENETAPGKDETDELPEIAAQQQNGHSAPNFVSFPMFFSLSLLSILFFIL